MANKELEIALTTYIALKHNQNECSGFIDGYKQCQEDMVDKSKQETLEEDSSSYQLAKNLFTEIYGYSPEIIKGNLQHEIIVAALQKGMVYGAKWQQEQLINSLNKQD